jgi:hypothetical protein
MWYNPDLFYKLLLPHSSTKGDFDLGDLGFGDDFPEKR